ncbi:cytosolic endo-beta-N-acetylglucosaminidase-like [Amblyomma americanum]
MSDPEVAALKTLEELVGFGKPQPCAVEPLRDVKRGEPDDPKILFCLDTMGGSLEHGFLHGCEKSDSYRFHHWHLINSFVYFSHHLVTIPPPGWISAGHKHGVKVLGTFTVEPGPGAKVLNKIRKAKLVSIVASQLAHIAASCKFDGWLINIKSGMDKVSGPFLLEFLRAVTTETHHSVPGSLVIWLDSVLLDGTLDWQSELNEKNMCFFNLCDGIFLKYSWTEDMLQKSAGHAGSRKSDVYVGIDVFAYKTKHFGGNEAVKVGGMTVAALVNQTLFQEVEAARKHGLSSAIFDAGWVYKNQGEMESAASQCRFWDCLQCCCPEWCVRTLPLRTSFCQGFGEKLFEAGQEVSSVAWSDLSQQQLQPQYQGRSLCDGCGVAEVCTEWAYNGGGCLLLRFTPDVAKPRALPYFRLFACDIPLGSLSVSYTFQVYPGCPKKLDVTLVLMIQTALGEKKKLLLGAAVSMHKGKGCESMQDISSQSSPGAAQSCWQTRKYQVKGTSNMPDAILEEIGISFLSFDPSVASACLLGELFIERTADKPGNKSANNSSSDEGLISEDSKQGASGQNSPGEKCPLSRSTTAAGTIGGNCMGEPKVNKLHECSQCGKAFMMRSRLVCHMRSHTGECPYHCDYCGVAFIQKPTLVRHVQSNHTGNCPYRCDHCGSTFAKKFQLVDHVHTHTDKPPYSCD